MCAWTNEYQRERCHECSVGTGELVSLEFLIYESCLEGADMNYSTGLNRISGAVTGVAVPITGGVFSIIEHITATTALTSFNSMVVPLGTTVPSIPSITSDTVSIITTPVPVAPLILPGASVSGVKTLKRRVLQRAENSVTEEAYNDPEKRRR